MSSINRREILAVLILGLLGFGLAGCGDDDTAATTPMADDVVLRVSQGGEVLEDWTMAELEAAIPFAEFELDGTAQNGPLLLEVLAATGVTSWETAEVIGMGEGRAFEVGLDITAAEVNEGWIFDVTKQGTLKLATADLPKQQWVRDVVELALD
jgi:hypothetical protein